MVEHEPSKLDMGVRFPLPALYGIHGQRRVLPQTIPGNHPFRGRFSTRKPNMSPTPVSPIRPASPGIRPSIQALNGDKHLRDIRVGHYKASTLLDKQIQIGLVGSGPPSTRTFVPQTTAAARLLSGPNGPKVENLLRGTFKQLDSRPNNVMDGIALSTSKEGYRLNTAMARLDSVPKISTKLAEMGPKTRQKAVREVLTSTKPITDRSLASYSTWVNVGPALSAQLVMAAKDGRTARSHDTAFAQYVVAHELEHAVTPASGKEMKTKSWLEEGTAELLSLQQRASVARAKAAGLPAYPSVISERRNEWLGGYKPHYDAVRGLLNLGGVSPSTKAGFAEATDILQSGTITRVPGKLARQIIEHNGLKEKHYEPLRTMIKESGGDADAIREIKRWVKERS